jgi:hypothetical protein
MKGVIMSHCKICGKEIDEKNTHFTLAFNKKATQDGEKKVIHSEEGTIICEECGNEGLSSVLRNLKLINDADTELKAKMKTLEKSVDMMALMKAYGISGEAAGTRNQFLARCPFHDQEASFLIDAKNKEYFCFCEGLKGDIFSFIINYDRDVGHKHTTLKQAVDLLMEKFPTS